MFLGESGKDAEQFPIVAYWDEAKTQVVEQPVITRNGFVVRNNQPTKIFIEEESCSITIKNHSGTLIQKVESYDQISTVKGVKALVEAEKQRALQAESILQLNINNEAARAGAAEVALDTKISNETIRATQAEQALDNKINANGIGNRAYKTYAEMDADKANIPAKSKVTVTNDSTASNNGDWNWDGTTFTKSIFDPVSQAAADATAKANAAEANSKTYTNSLVGRAASTIIPLVSDKNNNVPLWLKGGRLGFPELETETKDRVKPQMGLGSAKLKQIVPILTDSNGMCPLWLVNGLLQFSGIHPDSVKLIKDQLGPISGTANNVTGATYPIISDGASLRQWKSKVATLKYGTAAQPRLLITGDSWTDYPTIPEKLLNALRTYLGEAGTGWITFSDSNNPQFDFITVTRSGTWTFEDLNIVSSFAHGSGPDGYALTSSTAGDTLNVNNLNRGNQLTVFFGKTDGVFKYSVNGGPETTVTASSTGASVQSATIPISPLNNVVFTIVSGTVTFFGLHLRKSTGSGVEVTKIGNAGSTAKDYLKIAPTAQANFSDYLKPDVVVIILGTNDYRTVGNSVQTYKDGISALIDGYRTNNANCGVILVAPARSNGAAVFPLSDLRDAVYDLAKSKQCEFYNMYDDWDTYSVENLNGQWADNLHTSHYGAYRFAQKIFKGLLEI
ncbi:SGNH/GDSL hydrolase family protein [Acinetobacter baumannii]|uniref:SGNH/GDSL hydrolase family protein n=1 Tax=Acinetobacter baumannii TaxID=470 RepID=UPI00222819EC|nr:SGNH/GDSL hydrolase family protein [Acinetobacter baumannii]MCW3174451.1 SGNH/GDSL hydrolase family protein [Acinetobacter baumannii]